MTYQLRSKLIVAIAVLFGALIGFTFRQLEFGHAKLPAYQAPASATFSTDSTASLSYPLTITAQRQKNYVGGAITVEQAGPAGADFTSQIVSYPSDGLKIYALETMPVGPIPPKGWPVIILVHGFVTPESYDIITNNPYLSYDQALAAAGYVVLQPDLRGHGKSWGTPEGAYYSPGYVTDVLNLAASLHSQPHLNSNRLGLVGHSMGGHVVLQAMAVAPIKFRAVSILSGAVGTVDDMFYSWKPPSDKINSEAADARQRVLALYGEPRANPAFWNSISAYSVLGDIKAHVQLQVASNDTVVPPRFTTELAQAMSSAGVDVTSQTYPTGGHTLTGPTRVAVTTSVISFFNTSLQVGP